MEGRKLTRKEDVEITGGEVYLDPPRVQVGGGVQSPESNKLCLQGRVGNGNEDVPSASVSTGPTTYFPDLIRCLQLRGVRVWIPIYR